MKSALIKMIPCLPPPETSNCGPSMCRAPTEIKTVPQTQAALPPDIATSHTGCCHYTHAVVTTPNGLLLRALVCCRIYALNKNFKNIFQEYLSLAPQLHLLNVAAVSGGATSLGHGWQRRLRPRRGSQRNAARAVQAGADLDCSPSLRPFVQVSTARFTLILYSAVVANPSSNSVPVLCPHLLAGGS